MSNTNKTKSVTPVPVQHSQDPFSLMRHAFGIALDDFFNGHELGFLTPKNWENFILTPSADVVDEKDHIKIEAEMPGMGPEDITLSVNHNSLTIKGEKTTSHQDKNKDYLKREIHYGSYLRTIPLPETVDTAKATASFKKGMLWIVLPKKAGATNQARQIKIEKA